MEVDEVADASQEQHAMNESSKQDNGSGSVRAFDSSNPDLIQSGHWVMFKLPSGNLKLALIGKETFGKFGSVVTADLLGLPYEVQYEIFSKNRVRRAVAGSLLDMMEITADENANNRELIDTRDAQKLSHVDIEQLKKESLKGEMSSQSVIKSLISNSATFESKTEFSKAKYIKKKEKKFSKGFVPLRMSARVLCEYYAMYKPFKTREMRVDTLSQLLSYGNVRAGSKLLVVDDCGGLVVGAMLERMGGFGTIGWVHEHTSSPSLDLIQQLNFPREQLDMIVPMAWGELDSFEGDEEMWDQELDEERIRRRQKRGDKIQRKREVFAPRDFDGLICASRFDPSTVLDALYPFLAGGRPAVVYHAYREPLLTSFMYMRKSPHFVNASITESWLREYQVPVYDSGTHPHMMTSGSGGFLLSGIRVLG
ncbi:Gcd10p family-domain-containing protein [Cladochytrium replicatum]|nr:Gcd10p family-domain-containing protein [Cladochytrium replicatum]